MAEQVDLTAPVTRTLTAWSIQSFTVNVEQLLVAVSLRGDDGSRLTVGYPTPAARQGLPSGQTIISALNTANNSTGTSMAKRILQRLIADGYITGTVSGTPS